MPPRSARTALVGGANQESSVGRCAVVLHIHVKQTVWIDPVKAGRSPVQGNRFREIVSDGSVIRESPPRKKKKSVKEDIALFVPSLVPKILPFASGDDDPTDKTQKNAASRKQLLPMVRIYSPFSVPWNFLARIPTWTCDSRIVPLLLPSTQRTLPPAGRFLTILALRFLRNQSPGCECGCLSVRVRPS